MPDPGRTYIIAGAGIAGMTLALALARLNASVVVLERHGAIQEFGAGLQISPNARRILDRLGLGAELDRHSLEPQALDIYPQGGLQPLLSMELGAIMRERFGAPYAVMHRADLANALHEACLHERGIAFHFGVGEWTVSSDVHGVMVTIVDADRQTRTFEADGFVGADGVHSQTRTVLLGGPAATFQNRIAWRALVPFDRLAAPMAPDRVSVFFGTGFHLVCYPLPHRGQVNLAMFMPGGKPEPTTQPRPANAGPVVESILAAVGNGWVAWPMFTIETNAWHRGNVGLIGDAAHAMVPFQAQGAAMGIEDAATLAPLLAGTESVEHAFSRYASLRQPRTQRVAAISAQNGRIFHLPFPLSIARDTVMRLQGPRAHLDRLGWVYSHDAGGHFD